MGASFVKSTAPPYVEAVSSDKTRELEKILSRLALEVPLASQHRATILQAIKYVDADGDMRDAIILFDQRFYAIDVSLSIDVYVNISTFYTVYADILTRKKDSDDAYVGVRLATLLDVRRQIFDKLAELDLKVARIKAEPAYGAILDLVRGATTSCLAALWHKHGQKEAISMYYPTAANLT